jgi:hypothetical protein
VPLAPRRRETPVCCGVRFIFSTVSDSQVMRGRAHQTARAEPRTARLLEIHGAILVVAQWNAA